MAQEPPKSNNVEGTTKATASSRAPRKDVDLFPVGEKQALPAVSPQTGGNVARLGTQISIFNPVTFEEALEIVSCLRGRAATTISLDKMKRTDACRLVDFVSGASAALDGDFHKLTDQVYLFCPANIRITPPAKPIAAPTGSKTGAFDFLLGADLGSFGSAPKQ